MFSSAPSTRRGSADQPMPGQLHNQNGQPNSRLVIPHHDRISRLSERLNSLQAGLESERTARYDSLCEKLNHLDDRQSSGQTIVNQNLNVLRDQLNKLHHDFEEIRDSHETADEEWQTQILGVERRMESVLASERKVMQESEARLLKTFEEKAKQLGDELSNEGKNREDTAEALKRFLEVEIPRLTEALKNETLLRDDYEIRIMKRATQEISRLEGCLASERRAREAFEENVLQDIESLVITFQTQIEEERRCRETTQATLAALVEDACDKLDTACTL